MVTVPRSITSEVVRTQAPNVRRNVAQAGSLGRDIQQVGGTVENVAQVFEDAAVLNETMKAQAESSRRLKEIQLQAETDPEIWTPQRTKDEINKIREDAGSFITLPRAKGEFQFKFDQSALTTDFNIRANGRKRQIDQLKTGLLENLNVMKDLYTDASSPEEQQVIIAQRNQLIQENIDLGVINNEKGFNLKEDTLKEWQESDIRQAIATDAQLAQDMLLDGQFGDLSADETAKWIEVDEKQQARNKKVATIKRTSRHLEKEGELFGNLQETSVPDLINMGSRDEISAQVMADLIEWKTDPEGPQYETNKEIALEILRDSVTPRQDIRKFHERMSKALKDKDITSTDAFNITSQVQELFDLSESFETKGNPFSKALKSSFDFVTDWAVNHPTSTSAESVAYDMVNELINKVREEGLKENQIQDAALEIIKNQIKRENPSTIQLEDVPNAVIKQGQPLKQTFDGKSNQKPDINFAGKDFVIMKDADGNRAKIFKDGRIEEL